jgi:hypothetical protein
MSRLVVIVGVLLVMLLVPLWLNKQRDKTRPADAAVRAVDAKAPAPAPSPGVVDPERLGLTFGWQDAAAEGRLVAACSGQPASPLAGQTAGECDPRSGDTPCRTTLPLLCVRTAEAGAVELATTDSLPGFALDSLATAESRCAELGAGWRLARDRDATGLALNGRRAEGRSVATHQRVWVAADAGPGNCWDAPRAGPVR